MRSVDITGQKFGRLTAIKKNGFDQSPSRKHVRWDCICDCGKKVNIRINALCSGGTKSCGCLKKENKNNKTHGMSKTPEYMTWYRIRSRCQNPKNQDYQLYGARGIKVCDRWSSFDAFFEDMGFRPNGMTSIDRIDVNGDYNKENCRWANDHIQSRNKRNNVFYEMNGLYMCMSDWAKHLGINVSTLIERLKSWPLEKALSTFKENQN